MWLQFPTMKINEKCFELSPLKVNLFVLQVFLFELIHPEYRGPATAVFALMYSLGFSTTALMGAINPLWRINMAIMAGFTFVTLLLILMVVPESPAWLIRKGKEAEAASVMKKIRNDQEEFIEELQHMKDLYTVRMVQTRSCKKWRLPKPPLSFYFLSMLFFFVGWSGFAYICFHGPRVFMVKIAYAHKVLN